MTDRPVLVTTAMLRRVLKAMRVQSKPIRTACDGGLNAIDRIEAEAQGSDPTHQHESWCPVLRGGLCACDAKPLDQSPKPRRDRAGEVRLQQAEALLHLTARMLDAYDGPAMAGLDVHREKIRAFLAASPPPAETRDSDNAPDRSYTVWAKCRGCGQIEPNCVCTVPGSKPPPVRIIMEDEARTMPCPFPPEPPEPEPETDQGTPP